MFVYMYICISIFMYIIFIYLYLCRWFYLIYWCVYFLKIGGNDKARLLESRRDILVSGCSNRCFFCFIMSCCATWTCQRNCVFHDRWKTGVRFRRYRGWQIALQRKPCCFQVFRIQPIYGVYIILWIILLYAMLKIPPEFALLWPLHLGLFINVS